jgi:hypothetical protein
MGLFNDFFNKSPPTGFTMNSASDNNKLNERFNNLFGQCNNMKKELKELHDIVQKLCSTPQGPTAPSKGELTQIPIPIKPVGTTAIPKPLVTPVKRPTGGYRLTKKDKAALKKLKNGKSIGFTMRSSLKAKGLLRRKNGRYRVSAKYR